jgi:hypothetical protein
VPDPIVAADALPAASSAAVDLSSAEPTDALDALSVPELQAWRETGAMPGSSPVTDAAAASSPAPAVKDQPASTDAPAQAASEPAVPATPGADKRIPELLRDRAQATERAERAERRLADLNRPRQPIADARPAASSAAPAGLVKPDPATFPYGTADPGYLEALTDFKVAATLATKQAEWDAGQREARGREEVRRVATAFEAKAATARTRHADFDAVALLAPTEIPQGSAVDLFILEAPTGAEVLYHLQQTGNATERTRILRLGPLEQLTELIRLGDRLTAAAPAARSTQAPPPPPVLSTRATPGDAVERALAMGDSDESTGAYNAAANARDMARLKR